MYASNEVNKCQNGALKIKFVAVTLLYMKISNKIIKLIFLVTS